MQYYIYSDKSQVSRHQTTISIMHTSTGIRTC